MRESWPLSENFLAYIKPSLTLKELRTLREFYMAQQELAQELLEAKSLGICKITTSIGGPGTKTGFSEEDSKEML